MNSFVSIIYLCYNDEPYKYLERMFEGVKNQSDKDKIRLVIIYNPGDNGKNKAIKFIEDQIKIHQPDLPQTVFLPQNENIGFVGGNNKGIEWVLDKQKHRNTETQKHFQEYIFLHNGDGFLDEGMIEKMANAMDKDDKIGSAQAMVLMYPESSHINTSGNKINFLGLSYCGDYKVKHNLYKNPINNSIAFASGAAMMMRVDLLKKYGSLDKDFFIYLEDMEYCLRLKSVGYRTIVVPEAVFFHQYEFSNKPTKYYYLERNRGIILLSYYRILTLILIMPAWLVMEIGIWLFSIVKGWSQEKVKVYIFWLKKSSWQMVINKRKNIQANRNISDRELLSIMTDKIVFDDIDNFLLKYIANPFMRVYWKVVYWLVRW